MMWASTSSASSHAHAFSAQRLPNMLPACSWSLDHRTNLVPRLATAYHPLDRSTNVLSSISFHLL
jgi:hypothetical protein